MIKIMKKNNGYTLLFAMIVASIVLALGVSLLTISRKEFILSSSATQSSDAFYAADSGLNCAEYWNGPNGGNAFNPLSPASSVQCSNVTASSTVSVCHTGQVPCPDPSIVASTTLDIMGQPVYTYSFYAKFLTDGTSNYSCAAVTVKKYNDSDPNLGGAYHLYSQVTSAGYNIGWNPSGFGSGDCSTASPKKVNRTVQLTY